MESEDEDVIFENSVLHQALTDIGVTDLKTESRRQREDDARNGPNAFTKTDNLPTVSEPKMLCTLHSNVLAHVFYSPQLLEEVHHYHRYHLLKWLLASPLLSEDNQLFLQSYVYEEAPIRDPIKCLSLYTFHVLCLLTTSLILVCVVCPANVFSSWMELLIASMPEVFSGFYLYSCTISAVLLALVWVLCFAIPVLVLKRKVCQKVLSQMQNQDKQIKDLVMEAVELLQLEKKCLRLVRESELVARGFTLASQHHVASRGNQGHATFSSDQLCPGLRQVMLSENIKVMKEVKKWVVKMLRGIPMICMDSDFSTLEDFKLYDGNPNTEDYAQSDTEEIFNESAVKGENERTINHHTIISPSELSRSLELLTIYFSGFIRRLALCFYPQNLRDRTVNPYVATHKCIEMSHKAVEGARISLKQSYTFYRAAHQYDGQGAAKKVQGSNHTGQSQLYSLYICVNSLDLHLQSLLQITRNLALSLEDQVDKEQCRLSHEDTENGTKSSTVNEDDGQMWEDTLKRIKLSLESCRGCYEESLIHLRKKTERDTTKNTAAKEARPDKVQPTQTKVTWIPAEDPVIVDQVFEAVSDALEEEDFSQSRPRYTAQDRARHQEEKESIRRFQQELHAVVGNRAILQKAREEVALARVRGETAHSQESCLESSLVLVPEAGAGILVETSAESSEKVEPTEAVLDTERQSRVAQVESITAQVEPKITLIIQATVAEPRITCITQTTKIEPMITQAEPRITQAEPRITQEEPKISQVASSVRYQIQSSEVDPIVLSAEEIERETYIVTLNGVEQILQASLERKDNRGKFSFEQPNQRVQEGNQPLRLSETGDVISTSSAVEAESFVYKHKTNAVLQSEPRKECLTALDRPDMCSDSGCQIFKHGNVETGGIIDGEEISTHNEKIGQDVVLIDSSQPFIKCCTRCNSYVGVVESMTGSGDISYGIDRSLCAECMCVSDRKDGAETSLINITALKDSMSVPQHATEWPSNCLKSSSSSHDDVTEQNSCMSPNVRISHVQSVTTGGSRVGLLRQKDADVGFHNATTPISLPSSNFTKSVAILAALQARSLINFQQEEQFGDESSDSENSNSENDIT